MNTSTISITHMRAATIIDSNDHTMSFDSRAGESNLPIVCLCMFFATRDFLDDLEASKIVKVYPGSFYSYPSNGVNAACTFTLMPQFPYTNQLLETIIYNLFIKHSL